MTERGVKSFMRSNFKLGVDAGIAAGPVGGGVAAETANLSADILSFSRSKGLYGGLSLEGAVVKVRSGLNRAFYGKRVSPFPNPNWRKGRQSSGRGVGGRNH